MSLLVSIGGGFDLYDTVSEIETLISDCILSEVALGGKSSVHF